MVDEHTRESLCDLVAYSIDADATVAALERIVVERGTCPEFIRCDNGPELTANQRPSGLVPVQWGRHQLHRTGITVAEPLGRVLWVTPA